MNALHLPLHSRQSDQHAQEVWPRLIAEWGAMPEAGDTAAAMAAGPSLENRAQSSDRSGYFRLASKKRMTFCSKAAGSAL
jgi:hypothetical protein